MQFAEQTYVRQKNHVLVVGAHWRNLMNTIEPSALAATRRPASADRTARRQFQTVFPVITGSFPTNVIAHLHGLSIMDLTVGRTVGPTVDSTVG